MFVAVRLLEKFILVLVMGGLLVGGGVGVFLLFLFLLLLLYLVIVNVIVDIRIICVNILFF